MGESHVCVGLAKAPTSAGLRHRPRAEGLAPLSHQHFPDPHALGTIPNGLALAVGELGSHSHCEECINNMALSQDETV